MDGWLHLPRYVDKIRLHLAGKLHADYQPNLGKGFDGMWFKMRMAESGLTHRTDLKTFVDYIDADEKRL